jgi:hypothetical protein
MARGVSGSGEGESKVDLRVPVGIVPASLPGHKSEFFGCLLLKGNCVKLMEVWEHQVRCIVMCDLDAPFDAHRLDP